MKTFHINHDKSKLLIFFCGFYTDENCFVEFDNNSSDILFVYDYSDLDFSELNYFDFSIYTEINLIAYSYGVFAANLWAASGPLLPDFQKKVAVSGTIFPISENFGIHPKIYDLMLNSFNENTVLKFKSKMEDSSGGNIKNAARTVQNLKDELYAIKNYIQNNEIQPCLDFDSVIITKKDRIIPYNAQKNFWAGHKNILESNLGHFPFFSFKNFDEVLEV